jgi:hypothetical protein
MIQANELRVGCTFLYKDRLVTIRNSVELYNATNLDSISLYSPIPLTPEILEKCGFEKDQDGIYRLLNCLYWLDNGVLQISLDYAPLFNAPCKYLHQLQNLIFCLLGEELVINLQ